jgi:hypothetical protein
VNARGENMEKWNEVREWNEERGMTEQPGTEGRGGKRQEASGVTRDCGVRKD